ncbi:unnamed protein product [Gongylonema pulchrum]|uniref:Mediator of RNA polymerase II transcription subunit 33A n=1 Tax=Gongylonema pulchrum TaxID=637853 RepID=A0A183EAI6_9BILA|nr:unnamed protein product [Gongylonema pulchrum]
MVSALDPRPVYSALKNGIFRENIDAFSNEQIQPFLPSLLLTSFVSSSHSNDEASSPGIEVWLKIFSVSQRIEGGMALSIFEQDSLLEEVICAMTACALFIPDRFDPPLIVHSLLTAPNATTLITMVSSILHGLRHHCTKRTFLKEIESLYAQGNNWPTHGLPGSPQIFAANGTGFSSRCF